MANENQDNKNPSQSKPDFWTLSKGIVAFVVCAVAAAFLYPFFVRRIMNQFFGEFSSFSWEKYGQFGDSFGFVTAVFAGAAFFLLLKTYKAQKEELKATRQTMENQSLQNAFFTIMRMCDDALAAARYRKGETEYKGTSAIYYAIRDYDHNKESEGNFAVGLMDNYGNFFRPMMTLLSTLSAFPPEIQPAYIKIIDGWLPTAERDLMALICNQFHQQYEDPESPEVMRPLVGKYLFLYGRQRNKLPMYEAVKAVIDAAKVKV